MTRRNGLKMIGRGAFLAAALAVLAAAPAAAQVGVLDQPFRNDPFQPFLRGGWSLTHYLSMGADNNTLAVGDLVALGILAEASSDNLDIPFIGPDNPSGSDDGFRPTDLFLAAGLIPTGEGVRVGTYDRTGLTITFPAGHFLTLGVTGGVRVYGRGEIPDDVAKLARDGVEGDTITVDLTEMGGEMFGYAEAGVTGVLHLPLLPTPFGDIGLVAGAGARYVRSLAQLRFGFAGDDGDQSSTLTVTRTGVSTNLHMSVPIGEEILSEGGTGTAFDLMAGATLGQRAQLRLAITDIGSTDVTVGQREATTVVMDEVSFLDLGTEADSAGTTDTLAAVTRSVTLPTTFRADASFRLVNAIGFGARLAVPMGEDVPSLEPLFQLGVELRPVPFLPLRAGVLGGGDYGTGYFGGLGLDTGPLGLEMELASSGGPALADIRGITFRSFLSIRF